MFLYTLLSDRPGTTMLSVAYRGRGWSLKRLQKLLSCTEQRNCKTKLWVPVLLMLEVLIFSGSGFSLPSLSSVGPCTQALLACCVSEHHMKHFMYIIYHSPRNPEHKLYSYFTGGEVRGQAACGGVSPRFISWVVPL